MDDPLIFCDQKILSEKLKGITINLQNKIFSYTTY